MAELSRVAGSSLFLRVALRALAGGGGESCSRIRLPHYCAALVFELCITVYHCPTQAVASPDSVSL